MGAVAGQYNPSHVLHGCMLCVLCRRQVLDNQVEQLEVAIQRKLVEEAANEKAAAAKGVSPSC